VRESQRILAVEDDKRLAELIRDYLQEQGYQVAIERRGDFAVQRILHERPSLVILDLMLPGKDGLTILQQVRTEFDGPVLILTARENDMDQVAGLELGADDYVKKPMEPRVLLARIRALLRRFARATGAKEPDLPNGVPDELHFGRLSLNRSSHRVTLANENIDLTASEFELFWLLAANAGTILDRDTIYKVLRGSEYDGIDRSVDVMISRMRRKLGDESTPPRRIKTIWGRGYLFVTDAW
jgi:DNA-binding response OmpR family regulator